MSWSFLGKKNHFQLRRLSDDPPKKIYQKSKARLEGDTWIHFNPISFLIFIVIFLTEEASSLTFITVFFIPITYVQVTFIELT